MKSSWFASALFAPVALTVTVPPFAGWFAGRFGSHTATTAAGSALCLLLPGPLLAPNLPTLMMALLLFGAANGMLDVSMNAQAVLIEDRYRRPILSSLHGLYSAGGLAGASLAAVATSASIPADFQVLGLAIFLVPLLFGATRFLVHEELGGAAGNRVLAWPSRALVGLGALAFLALTAEGAMGDWAAVFLREYQTAGMDSAATGFAGFSLAMAVGRFSGDWARRRWGAPSLLRAGGLAAGLRMTTALAAPGIVPAVLGFTLFGLGVANMILILFGAAGAPEGLQRGTALLRWPRPAMRDCSPVRHCSG